MIYAFISCGLKGVVYCELLLLGYITASTEGACNTTESHSVCEATSAVRRFYGTMAVYVGS